MRAVEVGRRRVAVVCTGEDTYQAIIDFCPHEGGPLSKGRAERMWLSRDVGDHYASEERWVVVCPWHNFEYDLATGESPCQPERFRALVFTAAAEGEDVVVYV